MTNTKPLISFLFCSLTLFFVLSCKSKSSSKTQRGGRDSMVLLTIKAVQYPKGWGYDILADNKVYIHQNQVPAISGLHLFLSKEDAEKAANLMIEKLKRNRLPSIDSIEMQKAGIQYN